MDGSNVKETFQMSSSLTKDSENISSCINESRTHIPVTSVHTTGVTELVPQITTVPTIAPNTYAFINPQNLDSRNKQFAFLVPVIRTPISSSHIIRGIRGVPKSVVTSLSNIQQNLCTTMCSNFKNMVSEQSLTGTSKTINSSVNDTSSNNLISVSNSSCNIVSYKNCTKETNRNTPPYKCPLKLQSENQTEQTQNSYNSKNSQCSKLELESGFSNEQLHITEGKKAAVVSQCATTGNEETTDPLHSTMPEGDITSENNTSKLRDSEPKELLSLEDEAQENSTFQNASNIEILYVDVESEGFTSEDDDVSVVEISINSDSESNSNLSDKGQNLAPGSPVFCDGQTLPPPDEFKTKNSLCDVDLPLTINDKGSDQDVVNSDAKSTSNLNDKEQNLTSEDLAESNSNLSDEGQNLASGSPVFCDEQTLPPPDEFKTKNSLCDVDLPLTINNKGSDQDLVNSDAKSTSNLNDKEQNLTYEDLASCNEQILSPSNKLKTTDSLHDVDPSLTMEDNDSHEDLILEVEEENNSDSEFDFNTADCEPNEEPDLCVSEVLTPIVELEIQDTIKSNFNVESNSNFSNNEIKKSNKLSEIICLSKINADLSKENETEENFREPVNFIDFDKTCNRFVVTSVNVPYDDDNHLNKSFKPNKEQIKRKSHQEHLHNKTMKIDEIFSRNHNQQTNVYASKSIEQHRVHKETEISAIDTIRSSFSHPKVTDSKNDQKKEKLGKSFTCLMKSDEIFSKKHSQQANAFAPKSVEQHTVHKQTKISSIDRSIRVIAFSHPKVTASKNDQKKEKLGNNSVCLMKSDELFPKKRSQQANALLPKSIAQHRQNIEQANISAIDRYIESISLSRPKVTYSKIDQEKVKLGKNSTCLMNSDRIFSKKHTQLANAFAPKSIEQHTDFEQTNISAKDRSIESISLSHSKATYSKNEQEKGKLWILKEKLGKGSVCLYSLYEFSQNILNVIFFLQEIGLFSKAMKCPHCHKWITMAADKSVDGDGFMWICKHDHEIDFATSIRAGSFCSGSNLSLRQILQLCYMWIHNHTFDNIIKEVKMSNMCLLEWNSFFQNVCLGYFKCNNESIGGFGKHVEIHEMTQDDKHLISGLEKERNYSFMCTRKNTKQSFLNLIKKWIKSGSTIICNCSTMFKKLNNVDIVNLNKSYSYDFVLNIKNKKYINKDCVGKKYGSHCSHKICYGGGLPQFMLIQNFKLSKEDPFIAFCKAISQTHPLGSKQDHLHCFVEETNDFKKKKIEKEQKVITEEWTAGTKKTKNKFSKHNNEKSKVCDKEQNLIRKTSDKVNILEENSGKCNSSSEMDIDLVMDIEIE